MKGTPIERTFNGKLVCGLCLVTVLASVIHGDEITNTPHASSFERIDLTKRDINPDQDINQRFKDLQVLESLRDTNFVHSNEDNFDKRMAEVISDMEDGSQYPDSDTSVLGNEYLNEQIEKRTPMGFRSQLGKRVPLGYTGQIGKRFADDLDEMNMVDGQIGDVEYDKRIPMGFTSQLGKRLPMGLTSQLGKRLPMGYMSQLGKRMPMGFTSQLGKRLPMGYMSQLGKRMPMGFTSQLGKRMPMGFTSQLGKRMPMGFTSQLGKRMPMGFTSQLGKRMPMGFTSQLGKRMPMGLTSQLGKRETGAKNEGSNNNMHDWKGTIVSSTRKRRSTNQVPWYMPRDIPVRLLRGIDRYSFVSRLGKRSQYGFHF